MTRINKMSMQGFKSFAKYTEFLFGGDFNCVLGPNGSGKSNILDALCFVLGRSSSKAMRAEKSSNLIYNGGKSKKPAKEGEVAIYFDNTSRVFPTEEQEIKVSRIVRHNGQSIYKLNNQKKTRQEVLDLLSYARIDPEGFNIILQGDIVSFTEMPGIERRQLIEEFAGIGVYEEKKNKALRELERVDEKIKEAEIILKERETYLKELKNERNQAMKFKEMKDKLVEYKATLCHLSINKKTNLKKELDEKIEELKNKLEASNKQIFELKNKIEERKNKINEISKEIEEKGEKEQVDMHRKVEAIKVELATNKARVESLNEEIKKVKARESELNNELEEQQKQIDDLEKQKQDIDNEKNDVIKEKQLVEEQIQKFRQKHHLDNAHELERETDELDKNIEEKEKVISEIREKQQSFLREKDRLEVQIQSMDEKIDKVLEVEKENKDQIEDLKNKKKLFEDITKELNKSLEQDSSLASQLLKSREKLVAANEKLAALNAKNISIKEKVYSNMAIKKILDQKNTISGIYGTVSDLGNVSKKYSLALEIAAGNRIKSIVVEDDKVAAECIKYLKKNRFGVATFLPLNKIRGVEIEKETKALLKKQGVHGLAVNLVSFEPKFKKVFEHVFSNTIVVDDIDTARKIGIGTTRMVTLEGDIAEVSGAMQGGFRDRKKEGLGFQEKEIIKDIGEYEEVVKNLKLQMPNIEKKRSQNEEKISELRTKKAGLEGEIIKIEKSLHLESGDLEASKNQKSVYKETLEDIEEKIEKINTQISEVNKELADFKIKKQELRSKISQLRNPRLIAELNALEEKTSEFRERLSNLDSDIKNIDTQISMLKPENEKIRSIIENGKKETEMFNDDIKKLNEIINSNEEELKEKEVKEKEFYAKFKKLFSEREQISDEISKIESKVEGIRDYTRNIEIKSNSSELEQARINAELAGLKQEFSQYEGVKINEEKNEEQLKSSIRRYETNIEQSGNVNMKALEIYDTVEKEYNNLLEKKDSLSGEKNSVLEMIHEIEGKKKGLFMNTLEKIEENFKRIFSELSTKGEASLELENPENPFEDGLLIKVRLTGNKFMDIRSLSGGEKTMTALAFIFAIQEYEPHSFYILDEVDAALDKHNSEKLAKLVRQYTEKAQYIVISHNDSVISEADNLYGISMDEHGVSKVTSLKI
ncbi:chromosome segregation protein SMC [Candidatus Woesearchaeota archaeon]|nr:chromosome segregation protein SMC [Candidatus Woesearchaeota archaeon]